MPYHLISDPSTDYGETEHSETPPARISVVGHASYLDLLSLANSATDSYSGIDQETSRVCRHRRYLDLILAI